MSSTQRGLRRRRLRSPLASWRNALLLLLPTVALVLLYKYAPIGQAVVSSLNLYSVAGQAIGFVGIANYAQVLSDPSFVHSLLLTIVFTAIKVPVQLALGVGAALLLFRTNVVNATLRVFLVIPAVTPVAIIGIIFLFLFDREVGVTNAFLETFGLSRISWLTSPFPAQVVVAFSSIWRDAGFSMLIYLAGLTAIPQDVLEAARMDGAGRWQTTVRIMLPMLQRSTQLAAVQTTVSAFQFFAPIFVLTQGGPQGATDVSAYHIYQEAFVVFNQGTANAMSVILVAMIMIITGLELYLLRSRWEY